MINLRTRILILAVVGVTAWLGVNASSSQAAGDGAKLAWSAQTSAPINLPPVVAANMVMVVPKNGPLIAFDAHSGKEMWKYEPPAGVWSRGYGSDGKRLYICLKGGALAALNVSDGAKLWEINLGINCQRPPLISGETIYMSTAYVGTDLPSNIFTGAKLFSINSADGKINWEFTSDNYLLQVPYKYGKTIYVGGNYRDPDIELDEAGTIRIYALDVKTGKSKWQHQSLMGLPKALYATKDRLIYVGYQDYLVGVDTANGKKVWKRDTGNWVPSMAGIGNVVYYGAANTKVHAWDTTTGKTRWKYNIPNGSFNYLMGKPVFIGDTMYFKTQKGGLYALDRNDGEVLWSQKTDIETRTGISVSGKSIYIGGTNGTVYAYDILK